MLQPRRQNLYLGKAGQFAVMAECLLRGFNVPYRHHFRVTLMPEASVMRDVFARIDRALARRAEAVTKVVIIR